MHRSVLWFSAAALAFAVFVAITREFLEGEVDAVDRAILLFIGAARNPWLNIIAIDVTSLGSVTLVALFSIFALAVLMALRDRASALQLLIASVGGAVLSTATKDIVERSRPSVIPRLVEVSGFSFPSGHSLIASAVYVTLGIVALRHVAQRGVRVLIMVAIAVVLLIVGVSRVYLGVHYPTDVASGLSLGCAWALLLAGFFHSR